MCRHVLVLALVIVAALPQICRAELSAGQRAGLAQSVRTQHIVPLYDTLHGNAEVLRSSLGALCRSFDESLLAGAKDAFANAYTSFMAVQHLGFGPALAEDRYYRLQFWPDKHNRGGRQLNALLASGEPVPDAAALAEMSVAVQGFPALERLLFADDMAAFEEAGGGRACALSLSIAGNVETVSLALRDAWRAEEAASDDQIIEGVLKGALEELLSVIELKLRRPLGEALDAARPQRAEAWRSGLSYAGIVANLSSLDGLLFGESGDGGLSIALPETPEAEGLAWSIHEQIAYGIDALSAREADLVEDLASRDGWEFAHFMIIHVEAIRAAVADLFPRALDVTVGFNALDGD